MALLEVAALEKRYPIVIRTGPVQSTTRYVHAIDGVDLTLASGETLGLVGESGCGKSTLGRCLLRLIEPSDGTVRFDGRDLLGLPREAMRRARRDLQIVFQDPLASLNPRMTIGAILAEPLRTHQIVPRSEVAAEIARLLGQVGLPADAVYRYPHEFSGGQRQRVGIARALAVRPKFIVADEPVSALDVSIRAQILNLFREIQARTKVAILFIAHDLGAVRQVSDRVAVMYLGKIVETGPSETLFNNPRHPYTRALLAAIPTVETHPGSHLTAPPKAREEGAKRDGQGAAVGRPRAHVGGEMPSPIDLPSGCRFRTRCPYAMEICARLEPPLAELAGGESGHLSACHVAAELPAGV
jgi:oligopeptide/dipeptide ABC transporter ATP-binding protein